MKLILRFFTFMVVVLIASFIETGAQTIDNDQIRSMIEQFKKDERGPYQAIKWFCPDGSVIPGVERCKDPGGIQHALHKDIVLALAREKHIYLGQILAGTPFDDFLDADNQNSRLKQYQLEKFLRAADDGWIMRKGRYYRGAIQVEDEETWGLSFLTSLTENKDFLRQQFFLLRQAAQDIPHEAAEDRWLFIRSQSKTIADSFPSFMNLRVKIHGQPQQGDVGLVKDFLVRNQHRTPDKIKTMLHALITAMETAYAENSLESLQRYVPLLKESDQVRDLLQQLIGEFAQNDQGLTERVKSEKYLSQSQLLWSIRKNIAEIISPSERLVLVDLSNELEKILFRDINSWQPATIEMLLKKSYLLGLAAAGCGYIELWEWQAVEPTLSIRTGKNIISFELMNRKVDYARRIVEWGAAMFKASYDPVISVFAGFEPLANGFIDDKIRSSIMLSLGQTAALLSEEIARLSERRNAVFGIASQNTIRGLNPGFATGRLEVIGGDPEKVNFSADRIYALQQAPADMKPVAGIMTVSEGNLVSHVQLLARNLGIPNAVLSGPSLKELELYHGQNVFYAVSPMGVVLLKPVDDMTETERNLVAERKRKEEKVRVPIDKTDLVSVDLTGLSDLRASFSGKICGPKAANLGQLKSMFPEQVVNGFIIPFGMFRRHMDQSMPGSRDSYWQYLQDTFTIAGEKRDAGRSDGEIDALILQRLMVLRLAIQQINFLPEFTELFKKRFQGEFDLPFGKVPVFIRSDTNMEDLKDFTGAGLNLTVFNVLEEEKIWQAIRDVWASPYTERSYRWRQKYLLNPENVFPSILVIPGVNVDKSGVLITTGVSSGNPEDITVAFSKGVGGAVEGQNAETYLLSESGKNYLLSPSRETKYTVLSGSGGTQKSATFFNQPLLNSDDLAKLREFAKIIRIKLPGTPGIESNGPFDVELGFKNGAIWLFQVRPYVENKRARSSEYLQSLDPPVDLERIISLNRELIY